MRREQARSGEEDARLFPLASGRRTCTPSRASCGTRRCASARPSPPISSPRSSAPSACSWSLSSPPSRMRGRRTLRSHVDFDGWQYLSRNSDSDPTQDLRQEAARLFRLLPGFAGPRRCREHQGQERMAPQGEVGPGGVRRIPLRRMARDRQGAFRGRGGGGRQEGGQAGIRRRSGGGERGPQRALGEGDRVPAHHDQGLSLSLRHAVQGAGHGRVHRGADFQLDVHRRAARQGGVRGEEPRQVESRTARCRRCAC